MSAESQKAGAGVTTGAPRVRPVLTASSAPKLARHVRLKHDAVRQQWILLAPEKILTPSETAVEVLQLCDGVRTVQRIAEDLARAYAAPADAILADILPLLQDLADQGHLVP